MGHSFGLSLGTVAVIATVVIANLGNNIVGPVLPAIRDHFDVSAAQVGLVASGFGLGRLVMDLPAGYLTDRFSANAMFAVGILLAGGASALAASATSLEQLILFRTAMGFGAAIMSTVALVLLVGLAAPSQRGTVLALFSSAMLFGQALSPALGGYLGNIFTWRATFVFCAVTPLVSFPLNLLAARRTTGAREVGGEEGPHPAGTSRRAAPTAEYTLPTEANWAALGSVYFGTFTNFFNRHGMRACLLPLYGGMVLGLDPGTIGVILTAGALFTILINLPSGALADRIGRKPLVIPGMLTLCVGDVVLLSGQGIWIFTAATVFVSMAVLSNSMLSGLVADLTPERLVGRGLGMYRFTADLGVVIGPFVQGLVLDRYGFSAASLLGALVVMIGLSAMLALVPRRTLVAPVRSGAGRTS